LALEHTTPPAGKARLRDSGRTEAGTFPSAGDYELRSTVSVGPEPGAKSTSTVSGWRKVTVVLALAGAASGAAIWMGSSRGWFVSRGSGAIEQPAVSVAPEAPAVEPVTARVLVESVPAGAAIELDGTSQDRVTPAELEVVREKPGRLKLTRQGFVPLDAEITAAHVAAGKVSFRLAPRSLETVSISASGPYPFEIVEGSRVISTSKPTHEGVSVRGRQTIYLRSADMLLNKAVPVDPEVQRHYRLTVEECGYLQIHVAPFLERCRAFVDRKDLGLFPWGPVELAPGTYTVRLEECEEGRGRQGRATIRSGERFQLRIPAQ
jgi:hypothetical protein